MATPGAAAILVLAGILTIYGVQIALYKGGVPLLVAAVIADVMVAAGLFAIARRRGLDLGLRRPTRRFVLAAVLIGSSTWLVALQIVLWVYPQGDEGELGKVVERGSLWPLLVGLAVMPAFTEELVFRGVLARGLATRWPAWLAVLVSGLVFAGYHGAPAQVIAVVPLALALGLLAIRSGSVVPGMIAHLLNNTIALVLSRDELPEVSRVLGARPSVSIAVACVVLASGVALALKGPA